MAIYTLFIDVVFFQLVGPTFSTLFFFNLLVVHFVDIFVQLIWRSTGPGRYLMLFLIKFPSECLQNHVWRPIFDPSYDNIYKCDYFGYIYRDI